MNQSGTTETVNLTSDTTGDADSNLSEWCDWSKISIPYLSPCSGIVYRVFVFAALVTSLIGVVLNIVSLLAFFKMTLNPPALFLMKCLAVYDTLNTACSNADGIPYLAWLLGFGHILFSTPYWYIDLPVYNIYRFAGSLSSWTVCVMTVQR